jgi:hypothetical protein
MCFLDRITGSTGFFLTTKYAAAEQRNRFVLERADRHWLPHITPGGRIDRLVNEPISFQSSYFLTT